MRVASAVGNRESVEWMGRYRYAFPDGGSAAALSHAYSERRIRLNRLRRERELRRNFLRLCRAAFLAACLSVLLAVSVCGFLSSAKTGPEAQAPHKYYTSIVIEPGETLWSLAETYMGEQYETREAYVREVKRINALPNDTILSGQHLIVPYYAVSDAR